MDSKNKPVQLIKMINQIGRNLNADGDEDEVAAEVANHVKRFWTSAMIDKLTIYATGDGEELSAVALKAVNNLAA